VTKKATIVLTVLLTLVTLAYFKDPAQGQTNISNLIDWIIP
jgi:hypothetical protein